MLHLRKLIPALVEHGWHFFIGQGDWRRLPSAPSFSKVLLLLVVLGGVAEQAVRGHSWLFCFVTTFVWILTLVMFSRTRGRTEYRLLSSLCLLSLFIQGALILGSLSTWFEWPIAIWSGIAMTQLMSQARRDGAGAWNH